MMNEAPPTEREVTLLNALKTANELLKRCERRIKGEPSRIFMWFCVGLFVGFLVGRFV